MIFLFRKEIKKWNTVWWFVLASLFFGFGGASFFLWWQPTKSSIAVVNVDGAAVTLTKFQQVYGELKASLDDLALYWGVPVDRLAKAMGMTNLMQATIDRCIQDVVFDKIWQDFSMQIDQQSFQDALAATVGKSYIDQTGKLNLRAYQSYLNRLHMSIADYEKNKEQEFKRKMIMRILEQGGYVPSYITDEIENQKGMVKRFKILLIPQSHFLAEAKKQKVLPEDFATFFKEKQELYRVPEKKKIRYWILTPESYKDKVEIDENIIEKFYEKNKSSLYRTPPKVKVRTIVFIVDENASPDLINKVRKKVNSIYAEVIKSPEKFADFAKKYSEDKNTAKLGGLIDYFQRGTFNPEFERVAFLQLKNAGDISEIVRTKRGFEILKLEDRIAATEKPISSVRDDIVKTLVNRKSIIVLRGDLEAVIRTARTDKEIFEKFADSNKLTHRETDWLTSEDAKGYELIDVLAQKVFSKEGGLETKSYGYFVHRGEHILYKVIDTKKSFIPKYEDISEKVRNDLYAQKAEVLQKDTIRELKKNLIPQQSVKKTIFSLDDIGEKYGFKIIASPFVHAGDEIKELGNVGGITDKAFLLTDPVQMLEYKHDDDCYLLTLIEAKREDRQGERISDDGPTAQRHLKQRYLDGFVASLLRIAKIERNQNVLKEGDW